MYRIRQKKEYIINCLNKIIKNLNSRKKYSQIIELRKQKKTYAEIGKQFNISKQRVHQICLEFKVKVTTRN